ncbi:MAG: tripartite tricarboxylate transporter permease [Halobacteria archaeon]
MEAFLGALLFGGGGALLGLAAGLLPGLHSNTTAALLASLAPAAAAGLPAPPETAALWLACAIVAAAVTETFATFIPATFFGAPDEGTALVTLPGHRMLMEGRGYEAVALSALGSLGAVAVGFGLLIPFRLLVGPPVDGYGTLRAALLPLLAGITALLILTDHDVLRPRGPLWAAAVFLLSGALGMVALDLPTPGLLGPWGSPLMPLLLGLFGLPALLASSDRPPEVPPQSLGEPRISPGPAAASVASGTLWGALMGFLPGVTSAQATVLAMLARRRREPEQVILTLSAVNTANALFVLAAYFTILRPRSGAVVSISHFLPPEPWSGLAPPAPLAGLLAAVVVASVVGYFAVRWMGRNLAPLMARVSYRALSRGLLAALVLLTLLLTGPVGLAILAPATAVGMLPPRVGVRRTHAMGVLLLPVMLGLAGLR